MASSAESQEDLTFCMGACTVGGQAQFLLGDLSCETVLQQNLDHLDYPNDDENKEIDLILLLINGNTNVMTPVMYCISRHTMTDYRCTIV